MALDRAVKDKIHFKRDPEQEKAAKEWIEAVTGEKFPTDDYEEALHNGIVLCKLINKLKPGSVSKIHTQGGPIKLRENIGLFQNAARAYGVNESEVFQAVDCFDKQNIQQVTLCIFALSRLAQKNNFNGPILHEFHNIKWESIDTVKYLLILAKELTIATANLHCEPSITESLSNNLNNSTKENINHCAEIAQTALSSITKPQELINEICSFGMIYAQIAER